MKRLVFVVVVLAAFGLFPSTAAAISITQTFCLGGSNPPGEDASCPGGLTATLTITDAGLEGGEVNDFYVYLRLDSTGGITHPTSNVPLTSINAVQFDTEYKTTEYESIPTLDASGLSGVSTAWTASFGDLNDCDPLINANDKSVCGVGLTDTGNNDVWRFYIDLVDLDKKGNAFVPFSATSDLNLRASFIPSHNLSPSGADIPDTGTGTGGPGGSEVTGGTAVPEPASLMLLGSGLVLAAIRMRRRNK